MVEGKESELPLNLAKKRLTQPAIKRSQHGVAETFGLVMGSSSGSFTKTSSMK